MFHVPINAPTASRMKIALIALLTPPIAASATAADRYPSRNAISEAKAAASSSPTCSGPSVALTPKSAIVSAIRPIRTTTGSTASNRVGARVTSPSAATR